MNYRGSELSCNILRVFLIYSRNIPEVFQIYL